MVVKIPRRGRPIWLAALFATTIVNLMVATPPQAQAIAAAGPTRAFDIEPQPLADALIQFGQQSGYQVSAETSLTQNVRSAGVKGPMEALQALSTLLVGTGLTYRINGSMVALEPAPRATSGAIELGPVRVEGQSGPPSTAVVGNLPPPYAGGQVATGGQLGMLGNKGVMDTPFNQTSYTAQTIQDQQARTLADVLDNDPSVRRFDSTTDGLGDFSIRGFYVQSADMGLNGLYGIAPSNLISADALERVDVLKGPSALLNGMPPGGSVGGNVNLVTKRAGDEPLTRFTTSYISQGQFGEHIDLGRRFGPNNECGVRFNGSYTDGDTAVDKVTNRVGVAAIGLECSTDRLRASADFGYQKDDTDGATRFVTFNPGVPVLSAPPADRLYTPSWAFFYNEDTFGMINAEYDLAPNVTAYGAFGLQDHQDRELTATFPTVIDTSGNYTSAERFVSVETKNLAAQFGMRATTDTGPVNHAFNLNGSILDSTYYQSPFIMGTGFTSNLYNPITIPFQNIAQPNPIKSGDETLIGFGIADTLSALDKRVQLTLGVRHQEVSADGFDATSGAKTSSYDKSAWTPSYALVVKPWENVSLYANYIEGLQQGTIVGTGYANAGQILPPFVSKQIEAGIKVDWGKLTTTFSAFQITQPNLIDVPGNPLPSEALDGEQRNRGIELNTFGELAPNVRVLGGVMFIDGVQTQTQDGADNGKQAVGVPHIQLNLGAEWDTPFMAGLTLTGRMIYTSSQYLDAENTQTIPSWTRLDLGVRYKTEAWQTPVTVRFDVKNVADNNYWETNDFGFTDLGAPRTFLLSVTTDF